MVIKHINTIVLREKVPACMIKRPYSSHAAWGTPTTSCACCCDLHLYDPKAGF